jgi:Carboxypeptidase regulatory-like domain
MHGALLALIGCSLLAQTPKPSRVEGTVTNFATGAAVKKAEVSMRGGKNPNLSTVTDAAGHFAFENVPPGGYWLQLRCPGYSQLLGVAAATLVTVAEGRDIRDMALQLIPHGVVAGRVLDEDGDPMMHVRITLLHRIYRDGRRQWASTGSGLTNDLGEFRMIDVPPGHYYVQASPGPQNQSLSADRYHTTFYPNGADTSQASAQEVRAGIELGGIEFHMKKAPSFHVRGKVVDAGQTIENVQLYAGNGAVVTVVEGGAFDVADLMPGQHTFRAMSNGGRKAAREVVNVTDHDVENVTLTLDPGGSIVGSFTVEGSPVSFKPGSLRVELASPEFNRIMASPRPPADVKEDGSFEFHNLPPDFYTVRVLGKIPGKYLKSIRFGVTELTDGVIDLTGIRNGDLRLIFGGDGGQIRGTTNPMTMVTAALLSKDPLRPDQVHEVSSDPSGNFTFRDLIPGRYQVMAWEGGDTSQRQNPELRALLESKAVSVTVAPNEAQSAQVVPIPAADFAEAVPRSR